MTTLDILMIFVFPLIMGVVGTFGVIAYIKEFSPKEHERNTSLLLNLAKEDGVGFQMLAYFFAWIVAVMGWGILIIMIILYLTDTIKPV